MGKCTGTSCPLQYGTIDMENCKFREFSECLYRTEKNGNGAELQDTGNRREFETGAVRDIDEEKGRCDLMPLDVLNEYLSRFEFWCDSFLECIQKFISTADVSWLFCAMGYVIPSKERHNTEKDAINAFLDLSLHFRDGAKKYGERNWEKGIPLHSYIDSAVRHYLKWRRGDTDEPHQRAALWNIVCAIWTLKTMPEMDDIPHRNVKNADKN